MIASPPPLQFRVGDLLERLRARDEFAAFVRRPDSGIDLLEGALLVAREEYPRLDPHAYRLRLAAAAEAARRRAADASLDARLRALRRVLFDEEGYRADRENYYDPRNSYLNQVIDRRLGIPISLAIVYLEIGRHLGLPLHGVNFPGHFLVLCRPPGPEPEFLIDVYEGAVRVDMDDCAARLRRHQGSGARLEPQMLQPAPTRQILYRLLNNLKGIYMNSNEPGRALACVERMMLLVPHSAADVRDRGMLLLQLGFPELARQDLEGYLLHQPGPQEAGPVFMQLRTLHRRSRQTS